MDNRLRFVDCYWSEFVYLSGNVFDCEMRFLLIGKCMDLIKKKKLLMEAFSRRKQWEAEGKKKYGYEEDEQIFYDGYHDAMNPNDEYYHVIGTKKYPGEYHFSIQLSDSPEGDVWWIGRCKFINGDTDVVITKEDYIRS